MLELKKVSKFYYSKGVISSGFSKVSLNFDIGEFVAITGESGSGKSTLLNVISGLDSYEEGEMYISGKETSHYSEKDYEEYRKKYIGNIFQNFNLVNSYTVYQNIELVLLLNGKKKKDVKKELLGIIKSVGLYKYRNRKVSKLSGGQKQRVAIARVLAQDTPIILADEPTGNLDKESSKIVLKLLHELSKNKLVIVVTHNYDQISEYATRKITMHDGKVLENTILKEHEKVTEVSEVVYKNISVFNKVRLGIRNTFNIIPKFLLIFAVYSFIVFALFFVYSSYEEAEYLSSISGYNPFYENTSNKRIVIKKNDATAINEIEFNNISNLNNINIIVKDDLILDSTIFLEAKTKESASKETLSLNGRAEYISSISKVDEGVMPQNDNEIVVSVIKDSYYYEIRDKILGLEYSLDNLRNYSLNTSTYVKVVGLIFREDMMSEENNNTMSYYDCIFYLKEEMIDKLTTKYKRNYSDVTYKFKGTTRISEETNIFEEILPSSKVKKGKVVIPEEWSYSCKNFDCRKSKLSINVKNLYYSNNKTLVVSKAYNKKNFKKLTGYSYSKLAGAIFINEEDYNNLYSNDIFQSSVFIKDVKYKDDTIKELESLGFKTFYVKDYLRNDSAEANPVLKILKLVSMCFLVFALFFISYVVIKIVLKSRNVYYATLRILGSSSKVTKSLLNIELLTVSNLSYLVFIAFIISVKKSLIPINYVSGLADYVTAYDYLLLYLILIMMTLFISKRFSRKLFADTVMNTYREEV